MGNEGYIKLMDNVNGKFVRCAIKYPEYGLCRILSCTRESYERSSPFVYYMRVAGVSWGGY